MLGDRGAEREYKLLYLQIGKGIMRGRHSLTLGSVGKGRREQAREEH